MLRQVSRHDSAIPYSEALPTTPELLEALGCPAFIVGAGLRVRMFNAATRTLLGRLGRALGRRIHELAPP
ncbi:MAG: hypothetical protein WKH64_09455, partial [Chloroflexia bacterium]